MVVPELSEAELMAIKFAVALRLEELSTIGWQTDEAKILEAAQQKLEASLA